MTPRHYRSRKTAVIPSIGDRAADAANLAAIDLQGAITRYRYIVAWGKWLGFTPASIQASIALAETDNAPVDAIQKIEGEWLTLDDIANQSNRRTVENIAAAGPGWSR